LSPALTPHHGCDDGSQHVERRLVDHADGCSLASLHAAAASVSANLTVLVFAGVAPTLFTANAARGGAYIKQFADHFLIRSRSARHHPARDVADISAIEIQPDALG